MRGSSRSGVSLIEVVVTTALAGSLLLSVGLVSRSSTRAFEAGSRAAALDERIRIALDRILARLPTADASSVSPTPEAPFHASTIDFVPSAGFEAGAIQWADPERIEFQYTGLDPDDGVDNDGNGLIDDGVVVWIQAPGTADERTGIVCRDVPELLEGEIADGDDDNDNGLEDETGLSFDFQGSTVFVRLTIAVVDVEGNRMARTVTRAVALRNRED